MDDGSAAAAAWTMEWGEEYDFWEADMTKEDCTVLVAPALVSLYTPFGPTSFTVWADQGPAEAEKIRSVYAVFAAVDEE